MPPVMDLRGELWYVLPRGMRFERASATSIDLFVAELVAHSRYTSTVFAEFHGEPLPAAELVRLPPPAFGATASRLRAVIREAASKRAGLIIVQQHLPTAAGLAKRVTTPIVLQKHNFVRPPRNGYMASLSRSRNRRQWQRLSGLTFVSMAVLRDFERDWPSVTCPRRVLPNGLDLTLWRPQVVREKSVLVIGRATPEKGLLEAAQAMAETLRQKPEWTTTFVVSEASRNLAYYGEVCAALAPLDGRATIRRDVPAEEVRALNERAGVAVIPSKWREPFGRTCLEAHAGGAAVISSGTGGLREVSGDAALYLADVTPKEIAASLMTLLSDPAMRDYLAAEGRARVARHFDLRRIASDFDDFCAVVMANSR